MVEQTHSFSKFILIKEHTVSKNPILLKDMKDILENLGDESRKFENKKIVVTGCAGFLGYYFMQFFSEFSEHLKIKSIYGLDNFLLEKPKWIEDLSENPKVHIEKFDVIRNEVQGSVFEGADYVLHLASIASPVFYRKYPLETVDANIQGLRKLLDFYKESSMQRLLFMSSSEIYGDPSPENIPTKEEYRGHVNAMGPRACYDEAKRFGETLCYIFAQHFGTKISIVRPFNNFGPGMRLNDKRVPADFANAIVTNQDIVMHSDGSPTRTFCYVADAITGYLKSLLFEGELEAFNIGIDSPEINMRQFASINLEVGKSIFNYTGQIVCKENKEKHYLKDNPQRRCPDISKARKLLNYNPKIEVQEGVERFLNFLKAEASS